jgi:CubicO group peptidase (beta-lactamase class C family)
MPSTSPLSALRFAFALALVSAAPAFAAAAAPAADADQAALDALIAEKMDEADLVGLAAAIIVDGDVVWTQGYGYADRANGVRYTPDTVQNVGSISKSVLGVSMMQAVEDGVLALDADVDGYLPFAVANPHDPDGTITLRQLATHTSGIRDRWEVYRASYRYGDAVPEPMESFLRGYLLPGGKDWSPDNFVAAPGGTQREYSNIGAGLAGLVVERAVGEPLEDYAAKRIFAPLGMTRTTWRRDEVPPGRHSVLYVSQGGLTSPIPLYDDTTWPDGGLRTSVADLSKFFVALLAGGELDGVRILQPASAAEMQRLHYTAANKPANVELDEVNAGLFWQTKFDVTRVGHGGSDPGVRAEMLASIDRRFGVVLVLNTSTADAEMGPYIAISQAVWKRAEQLSRAIR